jgi:DNA-binding transcriptional regulator YiaG
MIDHAALHQLYLPTRVLVEHFQRMVRESRRASIIEAELRSMMTSTRRVIADLNPKPLHPNDTAQFATIVDDYRAGLAIAPLRLARADMAIEWAGEWRMTSLGHDAEHETRLLAHEVLARMARDMKLADDVLLDATFGVRLTELRLRAGLTQAMLAHRVRVSTTSVRDWEHDRKMPQRARLTQLCKVLHCTRRELLG